MSDETLSLRPIEASDQDFLRKMTYEAAIGGLRTSPAFEEIMTDPSIAACFKDWGKLGDSGLVALGGEDDRLGAAWRRLWPDGYRAPDTGSSYLSEVVMAVRPQARGQGVGRVLLEGLMEEARSEGITHLHLGVVQRNEQAIRLYRSLGFVFERETVTTIGVEDAPVFRMVTQLGVY